jgi:hypothetical protein
VKFSTKNYKINKTKNYIKTNNILFLTDGVNKNSNDWIRTEQTFKKISFKYYKVFNKTTKKALNDSVYGRIGNNINGITFFIKPYTSEKKNLLKNTIVKDLKSLLFLLLAVKLNNKFYSAHQLNKSNSLNYTDNKLLIYQFGVAHLKRFNSLNLSK